MAKSKSHGKDNYLNSIRNIGMIAHIDAGKTTLTERMLYYSKRIHRIGEVHEGTATMDYLPEEQERGITITSACTSCNWQNRQINIIDTPGHVDFTIEVERSLRVLDGAVGVFCAVGGVEPQSETVWRQSEHYGVPKLAFVNKMDRLGADFQAVLGDMREKINANPLVLQIPDGEGEEFAGIIDLLEMKYLHFDPETRGMQMQYLPLNGEKYQQALSWREALLENLSELDDSLLERYLNGEDFDSQELKGLIREAVINLQGVPVLLGSALKNTGVQPVMNAICDYLPSPLEVQQVQGVDPGTREAKSYPVSAFAPLSALVFKLSMETGRVLTLMRIYSGTIRAKENVYNATRREEQRIASLFTLHAAQKERLEKARAGEIVGCAGLKNARTGDTFCNSEEKIVLEQISEYKPVMSLALEPRNAEEEKDLFKALERILQEDPTLSLYRDQDTEQIILSGMGELHLEVVLERLNRENNIDFRAGKPQVVYQETIGDFAGAAEEFHRELGERWHYGYLELKVEPCERDKENKIYLEIDTENWPREWIDAVYQGLEDGLHSGVLKGYPVHGVKLRVLDLKQPQEDSSEVGYHMASGAALKSALNKARPLLMEPIMYVEIYTPGEFLGDVVSLLGTIGGKIENMFDKGGGKVVQTLSPLRRLFGFSTKLRSATQGRGSFIMKFQKFDVLE